MAALPARRLDRLPRRHCASILAAFTHAQQGAAAAQRILRGLVLGFFAFALFCFTVAETVEPLGIAASFGLAALVSLVVQALLLLGLTASGRRAVARRPG